MNDFPNIVICQCDQLRAFNIGCYGDPAVRTPHIDSLAATGTRFELAVSNNPLCTPARGSLLTGQYSRTCAGMLGNVHQDPPNKERVRLLAPTLPEILRAHGYRTGLIGKWHIDPQPQLVGLDVAIYPKIAHRYYGQTVFDAGAAPSIVSGFLEDFFAERVREFLEASRGRPFFLHYNISLPHQPIGPGHLPSKYLEMYSRDDVQLRPNALRDGRPSRNPFWFNVYTSADYFWRHLRKEPQKTAELLPDDFDLIELTRFYYSAISCCDDLLGRLLESLRELQLAGNTIVVFLSDHGDNLGSHGLFNKGSLIEESIRIPFIIHNPCAGQMPADTQHLAGIIDVMPTLLELAGLAVPDYVQGRSLAPILRGEGAAFQKDWAFIETGPMIGVRTSRYLYGMKYDERLRRAAQDGAWFYDLREDPLEENNLAENGVQPAVVERLREALLSWDQATPWLDAPEHVPEFGTSRV